MAHDPPGVTRAPDLSGRLEAAWAARGPDHEARTRLREADGSARYVNRLIEEASPYLVQHAHNPVDWRPWGAAAFAEAAERDVPVLLSVGYATCHWCHVMEEESFDDEDVAAIVNTHFVPVKLDREQRPDLDHTYITATQIQQGHAGWPNTVFLRPDGAPFHTGTYFPKLRFVQLLAAVAQAWREQRGEIDAVAGRMTDAIRRMQTLSRSGAGLPGEATAAAAVEELAGMHDAARGGFSDGQQFPQESFLLLLIDRWRRDGETRALEMAARTLDAIAAGGIHDHVGGGFHRYATDPDWRTPHFEKMLYNQAQIARAMVEGWQATGRAEWRRAAERCFDYVLCDMTDAEGAFFAAEDADSPDRAGRQEEGAFYVWTPEEVREALGPDAGEAIATLGLDRPPTVGAGAVPHLTPGAPVDADRLDPLLERLRAARDARPRPFRDEKVIAGWNGLMIRALAEGAVAFSRPDLTAAAARAGETLWLRHRDGERLFRLRAGGRAMERAMLEDHAWVGLGFLALHAASGEAVWLDRAGTLAAAMRRDFADPSGRMRMAAEDGPLGPIHESADGATPAGESSALEFLARLAAATGDAETRLAARSLTAAIAGSMTEVPVLRPDALMAVRLLVEGDAGPSRVLAGGALRLHLRREGAGLALDVAPAAGWHLTAPEPGAADLVGAEAEGARIGWPEGTERDLGGAGGAVRVLDGRFSATVAPMPGAETLALRLQPCSDALCAEPVRTEFRLPVDLRAGGGA